MFTRHDWWVIGILYGILTVGLVTYLLTGVQVILILSAVPGALYGAYYYVQHGQARAAELREMLGR